MGRTVLTKEHVEAAVLGGAVLGGGGGGSMQHGLELGRLAVRIGRPVLVDAGEWNDDDVLVTCSGVGAPAAKKSFVSPRGYWRTIELLKERTGTPIDGLITNECGGTAIVNGWLQAALLDLPVADLPCNGRAHPTGVMGSMGLEKVEAFVSFQAFAGGNPEENAYVEGCISGSLPKASALVRQAAVQAQGLVGVARNPVSASYAKANAAPGAVSMGIELGMLMLQEKDKGADKLVSSVAEFLKGDIVARGAVKELELETTGGFDVGMADIDGYGVTFWNEYMTLERSDGERVSTFPDLIMTMDGETGMPVTSAEFRKGQQVYVLSVPKSRLKLGEGMRSRELMSEVERIVNKEIVPFL
ncbi:MAG: DUF917 domain-containing protein [Thermovirgaceae bacterium]